MLTGLAFFVDSRTQYYQKRDDTLGTYGVPILKFANQTLFMYGAFDLVSRMTEETLSIQEALGI